MPERIRHATYTNPRTGGISSGKTHLEANPDAPVEATDRESPAYGFGTTAGRIVDRKEAYKIAKDAGQLKTPTSQEERFHANRGILHSKMYDCSQDAGIDWAEFSKVANEQLSKIANQ